MARSSSVIVDLIDRILPVALFRLQEIASLAVAIEAFRAQRIEREHDLAPVAAAHRRHQLLEKFGSVGECCLDGGETRARKARRLWHPRLDARGAAERPSQIEAGLGAGAAAGERRIE